MTTVSTLGTPLPVGSSVVAGTLRARLEELRSAGKRFTLAEAVHLIVPLCAEIADRHARGEALFVHPSSIVMDGDDECHLSSDLVHTAPSLPRDKACLAPEERGGKPGNARASVYAIGGLLYELVTGHAVGPGMRRPTELVAGLPEALEHVLGIALVGDPAHRPDDLQALAQAIHHLAPAGTLPPPPAHDLNEGVDVDVSLSMLPPLPSGFEVKVIERAGAPRSDSTSELAQLKERLESDPRPRYVVQKDGMDHGPFSAVELLQQIASHTFVEGDCLVDQLSQDVRTIKDWEEFAPFAEHARLNREIKSEKEALERTVVAEQKSTRGKAVVVAAGLAAIVAVGVGWMLVKRGAKSDEVTVATDTVSNVETDGGLKVAGGTKKAGGGGKGGVIGTSGGYPVLGGGMSCEGAQNAYVEEMKIGEKGQADLTQGAFASVLNKGSYFSHCGVPDDMSIDICAAVQNGRAVGVTVSVTPKNAGISGCISSAVRGLSFPSNPKLDIARTHF